MCFLSWCRRVKENKRKDASILEAIVTNLIKTDRQKSGTLTYN